MLPRYKHKILLIAHFTLIQLLIGEGKAYKAYEILRDSQLSANRYKLALVCIKLNKLQEAEKVLLNKKMSKATLQA